MLAVVACAYMVAASVATFVVFSAEEQVRIGGGVMGKSRAGLGRRGAMVVLGVVIATGLGATALGAQGGGHEPVTICHKPGTAAEHEITVDNASVIDAHLRHNDTIGPCGEPTPTPTPVAEPAAAPAATAVAATPSLTG